MSDSETNKQNQSSWIIKIASLGVGIMLGYTYYRKQHQPLSKSKKQSSETKLTIDTSNITLPKNIDEYFSIALSAAYEAGDLIKQFINDKHTKSQSMATKANVRDLVTEFDQKCEDIIISKIKSHFPTHKIIAEESHQDSSTFNITDEPTWFIDPIDGTTNFVHSTPYCCVVIGLRIKKIPVLGIVHCPIFGETFHGILGKGSYIINHNINTKTKLQTNPMKFDNDNAIKDALIITQDMTDRSEYWVNMLNKRLYDLLYGKKIRALRIGGSCAIDMVWVACGRADVFFTGRNYKIGPRPWDFTGPEIIVSEAGGITCLPEGKVFDCTQGRVLCCNNIETAKYIVNMELYKKNDSDYK